MNIYAGTQGGELQIVRRMRVGQLQGAMLSSVGLSQIDRSVTALQYLPLLFRDWDDVDAVRDKLRPQLEASLQKAGYVVLFWGDGGLGPVFLEEADHEDRRPQVHARVRELRRARDDGDLQELLHAGRARAGPDPAGTCETA